jgi:DnaJ-class molecular chaperone
MSDNQNYYEVLGVERTTSPEEIKKAYRVLSLKWHPDRNNGSAESTALFQKITQAYNTLSDEQERRQYDMSLDGGGSGGGGIRFAQGGFPTNIDPAEIFNFFSHNIFGGGGGQTFHVNGMNFGGIDINEMRKRMNKPVPIVINEEITLAKSYSGCTLPIEIVRGIVENGVTREEKETLYVTIPPGIDNGEMLILREKGHVHAENNKGDVKIFIKVTNTTDFVRTGLDLILHKSITLKEALCGFTFDMRYIDDRVFKINNGNGNIITHNYKKVIPQMGLRRENHVGNLIIEFSVIFPEKLSEEQIEGLAKIL